MSSDPIPDPIALLRDQHRAILDQQAALSIEARALAARVQTVTTELAETTTRANQYNALLKAIHTTRRTPTARDEDA